jgi:hypothetical protein
MLKRRRHGKNLFIWEVVGEVREFRQRPFKLIDSAGQLRKVGFICCPSQAA